jgi:hypothetical protein
MRRGQAGVSGTSMTPQRSQAWMKRVSLTSMPQCLAIAPARMPNRFSAPGSRRRGSISIIAARAASASTWRGPVSPQSRL